ncbi:MAG: hypothetical protein ACRDNL_12595 [Spirillospora sp.]
MGSSFPVEPSGSGRPAARRGGEVARPGAASIPLHQAGELPFGGTAREELWESIGSRTRARLNELAGDTIEWYAFPEASSPDGRPRGVVVGEAGLAVAEPRINTEHRPVYAISAYLFTPGSLRHVVIDHRPPPRATSSTPNQNAAPATADIGLSTGIKGVLGNLPPRAQELLQAPFTGQRRPLRHDWWYQGFEHRLNAFLIYLAGARNVTFATGTKDVPVGHDAASAHWSLTCYRASVERRIGR